MPVTPEIVDPLASFQEQLDARERAWLNRPTVHPNQLEDSECAANLVQLFGSEQRFASFAERLRSYEKEPTLKKYVRLRREFPEVEIEGVGSFWGDHLFDLEPELAKQGIDPDLVTGLLDAFAPDVDELVLQLMERLVVKNEIPKKGPGQINARRSAVSETMVDYLLVSILESLEWNGRLPELPPSLIVLIRERLTGSAPRLNEAYLSKERKNKAFLETLWALAPRGQLLSVRNLAKINGVSKTEAARWLKEPKFRELQNFLKQFRADHQARRVPGLGSGRIRRRQSRRPVRENPAAC